MYGVKDGCIQGIHDPEVTQGPGEMLKTNCCIDQIRTFLISTSARDTGPWRAGGAICKYAARPEMIYVLKFRFEVKSPNTHENSSSFHTTMRKRTVKRCVKRYFLSSLSHQLSNNKSELQFAVAVLTLLP